MDYGHVMRAYFPNISQIIGHVLQANNEPNKLWGIWGISS